MFALSKVPHGQLCIRATGPGRVWLRAQRRAGLSDIALEARLFHLLDLQVVAPEWIGALTAAPIVTDNFAWDETGRVPIIGTLWWFPQYAVVSLVGTLIDTGEVLLTNAEPTPAPAPSKRNP